MARHSTPSSPIPSRGCTSTSTATRAPGRAGSIGALELGKRNRDMILPHEDVIPAIVADRLAMTVAAPANLEPILLVYDGDKATSGAIAAAREASRP